MDDIDELFNDMSDDFKNGDCSDEELQLINNVDNTSKKRKRKEPKPKTLMETLRRQFNNDENQTKSKQKKMRESIAPLKYDRDFAVSKELIKKPKIQDKELIKKPKIQEKESKKKVRPKEDKIFESIGSGVFDIDFNVSKDLIITEEDLYNLIHVEKTETLSNEEKPEISTDIETVDIPPYKIQNYVFTCTLNMTLNSSLIVKKLYGCGAQYNKSTFSAVVLRYGNGQDEPKHTATLIFSGGITNKTNIVVTGANDRLISQTTLYNTVNLIKTYAYPDVYIVDQKCRNVVVTFKVPWKLDLKKLLEYYPNDSQHTKKVFPGVILKLNKIKPATALVFHSGSVVLTGSKSEDKVKENMKIIVPIFYALKKINFMGSNNENSINIKEENKDPFEGFDIFHEESIKKEFINYGIEM